MYYRDSNCSSPSVAALVKLAPDHPVAVDIVSVGDSSDTLGKEGWVERERQGR